MRLPGLYLTIQGLGLIATTAVIATLSMRKVPYYLFIVLLILIVPLSRLLEWSWYRNYL